MFVRLIASLIKSGVSARVNGGLLYATRPQRSHLVYVSALITLWISIRTGRYTSTAAGAMMSIYSGLGKTKLFHDWICMLLASRYGLPKFLVAKHQPSIYGSKRCVNPALSSRKSDAGPSAVWQPRPLTIGHKTSTGLCVLSFIRVHAEDHAFIEAWHRCPVELL